MAIATIFVASTSPAANAAVGWHTKLQAERNILNAPKALDRWSSAFVNRKTHLVQRNVIVSCLGLAPAAASKFRRFSCVVRYRRLAVKMIYLAQAHNGFELRGRPVSKK